MSLYPIRFHQTGFMLVFLSFFVFLVMNNFYIITQLPNVSYIFLELHFGQITLASHVYRPHRLKLVASD